MNAIVNISNYIKSIMIKISEDKTSEITHQDMYNSLVSMIKWTRQFRNGPEIIELTKYLDSTKMWAKEFCTIKFSLPRQSGHTTFIKKMVGQMGPEGSSGELFKTPVLVFPNMDIIRHNDDFYSAMKYGLVTTTKMSETKYLGRKIDGVIVDCASLLSSSEIDHIYDTFKHFVFSNPNFVFVFLE